MPTNEWEVYDTREFLALDVPVSPQDTNGSRDPNGNRTSSVTSVSRAPPLQTDGRWVSYRTKPTITQNKPEGHLTVKYWGSSITQNVFIKGPQVRPKRNINFTD